MNNTIALVLFTLVGVVAIFGTVLAILAYWYPVHNAKDKDVRHELHAAMHGVHPDRVIEVKPVTLTKPADTKNILFSEQKSALVKVAEVTLPESATVNPPTMVGFGAQPPQLKITFPGTPTVTSSYASYIAMYDVTVLWPEMGITTAITYNNEYDKSVRGTLSYVLQLGEHTFATSFSGILVTNNVLTVPLPQLWNVTKVGLNDISIRLVTLQLTTDATNNLVTGGLITFNALTTTKPMIIELDCSSTEVPVTVMEKVTC